MSRGRRVVITGVGVVNASVAGGADALATWLSAPAPGARAGNSAGAPGPEPVDDAVLRTLLDGTESRRLSRVSQLTVAAARVALADARVPSGAPLGLVVGTETGDLRSTMEFADGFLGRGPAGLSALLFPNTVMNTMAAATSIAVQARASTLTVAAPVVGGELAVARAAATIAASRADILLAGGVDQLDPLVTATAQAVGAGNDARGEGSAFLVLEALDVAVARGATVIGEVRGAAWRGLPARPCGIGRRADALAIVDALADAGVAGTDISWVYASASGDREREAWEERLITSALGSAPRIATLGTALGRHAALGAVAVAASAWTARCGLLPWTGLRAGAGPTAVTPGAGLVHGVARGGTEVALVVDVASRER